MADLPEIDHASARRFARRVIDAGKRPEAVNLASAYLALDELAKTKWDSPQRGFIDMKGRTLRVGGSVRLTVLDRCTIETNPGSAIWYVRFEHCGHIVVYSGTYLRTHAKHGSAPPCRDCGPAPTAAGKAVAEIREARKAAP